MSDLLPETYGQGFQSQEQEQESNDFSTPYNDNESTAEETQEPQSNVNPAWNELLSSVPEEFHPHLIKGFEGWDKGVQNRFEKVQQQFAPYKEFAELNVPATDISTALSIYQAINTQPKAVFEYLRDQFNFGQEQSQGQREGEKPPIEDYDLSLEDQNRQLENDPRFKEVAEKASRAEQFIQNMQRQEQQRQVDFSVANEAKAVEEKYPDIDMAAVATFAIGQANQTNQLPNLMAAADYLQRLMPQQRVSDTAPPIVRSGNSRIPATPAKPFGRMTSEERSAYVANQLAAMNQDD